MTAKKLLKISGKILLGVFLFIFLLGIILFTLVDRSPIQEQEFYKNTFADLERMELQSSSNNFWLSGWGKANMTPETPAELVGYAPRGKYEFVQDSSFVKALTISNGKSSVAWLSYELLIVHPHLAAAIDSAIQQQNLPLDQVVFTATHTHAGLGGYMPGPVGDLAFGGYDDQIVQLIVDKSISALNQAISSQDTASIQYKKINAKEYVANRFIKEDLVDPFVRQLIISKKNGKKGTFLTFSAHSTILSSRFMGLSGDYPFYLMQDLEEDKFDFAMFAAGTVGSQKPVITGKTPEIVEKYAQDLDSILQIKMTSFATVKNNRISYGKLPLQLREPHLRISDNIRIRPWLFNYLLGETNVHFDVTIIGNLLFIASSGEISGVFYEKWERVAHGLGLNLIITSFNGGYMGYITPDEYYDKHFHEVREMNWYGPGNGDYYDELIIRLIEKAKSTF